MRRKRQRDSQSKLGRAKPQLSLAVARRYLKEKKGHIGLEPFDEVFDIQAIERFVRTWASKKVRIEEVEGPDESGGEYSLNFRVFLKEDFRYGQGIYQEGLGPFLGNTEFEYYEKIASHFRESLEKAVQASSIFEGTTISFYLEPVDTLGGEFLLFFERGVKPY